MSPYTDDIEAIPPGSILVRRISTQQVDWATLDDDGRPRVTKEAVQFYDLKRALMVGCPGPALSVIALHMAPDLETLVARYTPAFGLARLPVDAVRSSQCGVQLWPLDEEPAHAVVFRLDGGSRPSDGVRKQWAEQLSAGWIRLPPQRT